MSNSCKINISRATYAMLIWIGVYFEFVILFWCVFKCNKMSHENNKSLNYRGSNTWLK